MNYKNKQCLICYSKISNINPNELYDDSLRVVIENNRRVYFSPVGNQFNFGYFNNGHTPKIVILGITTSYDAYNNFKDSIKKFITDGDEFSVAYKKACILNIFNSNNSALRKNLNELFRVTEMNNIIGTEEISLGQNLKNYIDGNGDEATKNMLQMIYFSQAIPCASCDSKNGSGAPDFNKEIGDFQKSCINAQVNFIQSFKNSIELMIVMGKGFKFASRYGSKLRDKCKREIITIDHLSGRPKGWNELKHMTLSESDFDEYIYSKATLDQCTLSEYKKCYNLIQRIKDQIYEIVYETNT